MSATNSNIGSGGPRKRLLRLVVNGEVQEVATLTSKTLLEVLREDLNLTGTKHGCEVGECGTCTILLDNEPILSCLILGIEAEGKAIRTVEGLSDHGKPNELQQAFAELGAAQCGYCTPGILLTAQAYLEQSAEPERDREEIREVLSGNLCRCTGYTKILDAVQLAATRRAAIASQKGGA